MKKLITPINYLSDEEIEQKNREFTRELMKDSLFELPEVLKENESLREQNDNLESYRNDMKNRLHKIQQLSGEITGVANKKYDK